MFIQGVSAIIFYSMRIYDIVGTVKKSNVTEKNEKVKLCLPINAPILLFQPIVFGEHTFALYDYN